ncbi:hypothetical protein LA345_36810 (plasmid) [Burkholderia vietnamiensis]|uniref:Uncharacterized protein n=1 Tax=Burkholderia vietnamiensis (strain G4 / LMG 22486) TaxID=269482 RepID=A4JV84_BURVG|nr:hypothetical protein Bcep1808_7310 [Burkholderia vietnamiensis G4]MCB4349375.1 hypothetical protein [Burkholderia vietnamiensis]
MGLFSSNEDAGRLALPAHVFIEAVRLAAVPRRPVEGHALDEGLRGACVHPRYAAVDYLTDWWNHTAPSELRGAFSFTPYVKVRVGWASGDIEEGYVSEKAMAQTEGKRGEATLLDRIVLVFYRKPTTNGHRWFAAPRVDGSHGAEGVLPAWLAAEELLATDAYDALHEFPFRFDDLWGHLQSI